jgi:hypothetical protein
MRLTLFQEDAQIRSMRVFILSSGRCGSVTFIRACQHIENYTAAHESLTSMFGADRFRYPDHHIEADNRLSWQLGLLNQVFKNDALYVYLRRDRDRVATSYMKRFYQPGSIMDSFCDGIKMVPPEKLDYEERLTACYDYIDTVNSNIEYFLSDKSNTLTIHIENIDSDFPLFWHKIGATGRLNDALKEFRFKQNTSSKRSLNYRYRIKLLVTREWRHLMMYLRS